MNPTLRAEIESRINDIKKVPITFLSEDEFQSKVLQLAYFLSAAMGEDESAYIFNFLKIGKEKLSPNWNRLRTELVAYLEGRLYSADWTDSSTNQSKSESNIELITGNLINNKIFVVHGHDDAARESVARFIEKLGLIPIILHEQANQSLTVIEKLERHSDVQFAVVLLSPDDEGRKANTQQEFVGRARQNVLIELGYFVGKLGRSNVCPLRVEGTEIPSDFSGVVYTDMDKAGAWRTKLAQELISAKFAIDLKALIA